MGSHNESNAKKEEVTQIKKIILGGNINNIKSKYILQKIFDRINKVRFLKIIKYNKNIKNRINQDINYFKEFSETQTPIEIELVPNKLKINSFIDTLNKVKDLYYHVYINDNITRNFKKRLYH